MALPLPHRDRAALVIERAALTVAAVEAVEAVGFVPDRIALLPAAHPDLYHWRWIESPGFESAYGREEFALPDGRTLVLPCYEDDDDDDLTPTPVMVEPFETTTLAARLLAPRGTTEPAPKAAPLSVLARFAAEIDPMQVIHVWQHGDLQQADWPIWLGGDEDWVAFVPEDYRHATHFLDEGSSFGCCSVEVREVDGGHIHIGCHA